MTDRCEIPRCRAKAELIYLEHGICADHWKEFTADDARPEALRMALGIEADAPAATEATMEQNTGAETTAPTEDAMKKKTAKAKAATPKAAKAKKAKTLKTPKPTRERIVRDDFVTFAVRLPKADSAAFHKIAGSGKASQYARKLLVVFSNEDEPGFRALLKEAREARSS